MAGAIILSFLLTQHSSTSLTILICLSAQLMHFG
jgi:hypothetical protein